MGSRQGRAGAAYGLWRPHHRSRAERRSLLSKRRSLAGLRAARNRTARQPPAAAAGGELSSIMVGAIRPAAGAAHGTVLSAAGDRRAARRRRRRAAGLFKSAARFSASKTPKASSVNQANKKLAHRTE